MWQPIETAPKNGSYILLATPKGRIADGFWSPVYGVWSWPYVMIEPTHWMPLPELPGAQAQPAPSVPEDVMRDAERYRYLRARDDGTAGVGCWIEADGRVCDRGWLYGVQLDSAIDSFIEVLAAAPKPEAKP